MKPTRNEATTETRTRAALSGALLAIAAGCTPAGGAVADRAAASDPGATRGQSAPAASAPRPPPVKAGEGGATQPIAVVELFTSEGCSSCPPADDVLRELTDSADPRVLTLSFHVDYWDDLGWPDPFSTAASTARQRAYSRVFGTSGVYTPQMIVGGRDQFVGSDRARARRSIEAALSRGASARVALSASARAATGEVEARYDVEGAPDGAVLVVALVEDGIVSHVPRGENSGKTLRHESVVRAFETVRLPGDVGATKRSGIVRLSAPPASGPGARALVGYVQRQDLTVVGAARAPLGG